MVEAQDMPEIIHPQTLEEEPPEVIKILYDQGSRLITENGWYILLAILFCAWLWPKVRQRLDRLQEQRERKLEEAKRKKDPEFYKTRQMAYEVARLRMQVEHSKTAQLAAEMAAEKEEKKRLEKLAQIDTSSGGVKLGSTSDAVPPKKEKNESLKRNEYNPLMGGGTSGGFRPSRRSCPGGGCG